MNGAILTLRSTTDADAQILGKLDESGAMMFPLLLARHPAFFELRAKPGAMDFLPPDAIDGRWS